MSDLTANVNVRTTHHMKKRIMDEAYKRGMKISECILFSLEDYWNIIEKGIEVDENRISQLSTLLETTQAELTESKTIIQNLTLERDELTNTSKGIWQEANAIAERLSKERIEQERAIAVREYFEEVNSDQEKLQWYVNRLSLYETDTLKKVFQVVKQNARIKDLPDVVQSLVQQYFQQFLNNHKNVQIQ